jgi:hypothetical protein
MISVERRSLGLRVSSVDFEYVRRFYVLK